MPLEKLQVALPEMIGRTIKHIGVGKSENFMNVYLEFADGTHYEFYGRDFNGARHVSTGTIDFMNGPPIAGVDRLYVLDRDTSTLRPRLPKPEVALVTRKPGDESTKGWRKSIWDLIR